jgi:demethylmenaquinone methyltransferase/2-methoxy-6-polyprenyl-1,4-benzoquinol methylase
VTVPIADPQAPHPPLTAWYADEPGRLARVRRWFDSSAADYDRINTVMSFGTGGWYRREALVRLKLAPGERLLDVGSGTGVIAAAAQKIVGDQGLVVALDPSSGMLTEALARGVKTIVPGRGERLPFADASFDAVTMGYALRHVADLDAAMREYARVLRPGGRVMLLEITRPASRFGLRVLRFYMRTMIPALTRLFQRGQDSDDLMRYYWDTIEHCVPPARILQALTDAGFAAPQRRVEFGMFSEYSGSRP